MSFTEVHACHYFTDKCLALSQRHSSGRERPATAPLDPREVVTEVDAWGPAERALESGLCPKEVHAAACTTAPFTLG